MNSTTSHHQTAIIAVPASGPGALPGFDILCDICGKVGRYSLQPLALEYAAKHTVYMDRSCYSATMKRRVTVPED